MNQQRLDHYIITSCIIIRKHSRAMNKAFTLALCELSLWLLAGMKISKFVQFHGYLSLVSLRLQMDYPNTRLSWLTRQLDLELMFTSIISLRRANWIKWEKLFTDLLALSTDSTYSLALFIRFGELCCKRNSSENYFLLEVGLL